jgi:hypothetical protein
VASTRRREYEGGLVAWGAMRTAPAQAGGCGTTLSDARDNVCGGCLVGDLVVGPRGVGVGWA